MRSFDVWTGYGAWWKVRFVFWPPWAWRFGRASIEEVHRKNAYDYLDVFTTARTWRAVVVGPFQLLHSPITREPDYNEGADVARSMLPPWPKG